MNSKIVKPLNKDFANNKLRLTTSQGKQRKSVSYSAMKLFNEHCIKIEDSDCMASFRNKKDITNKRFNDGIVLKKREGIANDINEILALDCHKSCNKANINKLVLKNKLTTTQDKLNYIQNEGLNEGNNLVLSIIYKNRLLNNSLPADLDKNNLNTNAFPTSNLNTTPNNNINTSPNNKLVTCKRAADNQVTDGKETSKKTVDRFNKKSNKTSCCVIF